MVNLSSLDMDKQNLSTLLAQPFNGDHQLVTTYKSEPEKKSILGVKVKALSAIELKKLFAL